MKSGGGGLRADRVPLWTKHISIFDGEQLPEQSRCSETRKWGVWRMELAQHPPSLPLLWVPSQEHSCQTGKQDEASILPELEAPSSAWKHCITTCLDESPLPLLHADFVYSTSVSLLCPIPFPLCENCIIPSRDGKAEN